MPRPKTHYTFTCAEHSEYGVNGWVLANMPAFEPLSGMGTAHDILEHWPNDDSTTGELLALGASMYVRGSDYFAMKDRAFTSPAYQCHGEIANLLYKIDQSEWVPLKPCQYSMRCGDIQHELDSLPELIHRYCIEDISDEYLPTDQDMNNVLGWLAEGYRRAQKRYKGIDHWDLLQTFMEIERKADNLLNVAILDETLHVILKWVSCKPQLRIYTE